MGQSLQATLKITGPQMMALENVGTKVMPTKSH